MVAGPPDLETWTCLPYSGSKCSRRRGQNPGRVSRIHTWHQYTRLQNPQGTTHLPSLDCSVSQQPQLRCYFPGSSQTYRRRISWCLCLSFRRPIASVASDAGRISRKPAWIRSGRNRSQWFRSLERCACETSAGRSDGTCSSQHSDDDEDFRNTGSINRVLHPLGAMKTR